jgi:hypothetical protein
MMRDPKLLLNNNGAGKAEDIYLFIGKHPKAAFGNSDGDRGMLEYTQAGGGASLKMLVFMTTPPANTRMAGAGIARFQGRYLSSGVVQRGQSEGLDRNQHEEPLEEDFFVGELS